jgi:hypothetical protein
MATNDNTTPPPVDPISAFWRDVWARAGVQAPAAGMPNPFAGAAGFAGMPNMSGMGMPAGFPTDPASMAAAMMTPEALRRMQSAFFDAMAQHAEQTMRSPQFLEAMKRSMDQALQHKRQMDDFLKSNMASAFETATGGANGEILNAIRQSHAEVVAEIRKLESRVAHLEQASGASKPVPAADKTTDKSGKRGK